jgi:hypothetical protein
MTKNPQVQQIANSLRGGLRAGALLFPHLGRNTVKDLWITCVCFGGIFADVLIFISRKVFYLGDKSAYFDNSL